MQRIMLFWDARNILKGQEAARKDSAPRLDYALILASLSKFGTIIRGYYYDGTVHRSRRTIEKERFFSFMRKIGFTLRLKEIDFDRANPSQKGVDIYLTADMIRLAYEDAYDIAVLASGDGDFEALVELIKSKGKRVWVLSFKSSLSRALRENADRIFLLDSGTLEK